MRPASKVLDVVETDLLVRLGGDEFGLLLPDCPTAYGLRILDRFRSEIPEPHTLSAGIATWDGTQPSDAVIERADEALYEDKRGKKDRAVEPASRGTSQAALVEQCVGSHVER